MSVQKEDIVELFERLNEDEKESTCNDRKFLTSLKRKDRDRRTAIAE